MRRAAPSDPRAQLRRGSQLNSLPWGTRHCGAFTVGRAFNLVVSVVCFCVADFHYNYI